MEEIKAKGLLSKTLIYSNDKSHLDGDFIAIYNWNTPEFTTHLQTLIQDIPFEELYKNIKKQKINKKRGNDQYNVGFTGQSYDTEYEKKYPGVKKPSLSRKHGSDIDLKNMKTLSKIIKTIKGNECFAEEHRNTIFANTIPTKFQKESTDEIVTEGYTAAITNRKKILQCHVDGKNDRRKGYDTVICCSAHIVQDDSIQRVAALGYGKKCCSDFFKRNQETKIWKSKLEVIWDNLPLQDMLIGKHLHKSFKTNNTITPHNISVCVTNAHCNKLVYFSAFKHLYEILRNKHQLSLDQQIEMLLPIGWINSTEIYCYVINLWCSKTKLPDENLAKLFIMDAKKNMIL